MRIFLVTPSYTMGGTELFFKDFFEYLLRLNHAVYLIDYHDGVFMSRKNQLSPNRLLDFGVFLNLNFNSDDLIVTSFQFFYELDLRKHVAVPRYFLMVLHKWHFLYGFRLAGIYRRIGFNSISMIIMMVLNLRRWLSLRRFLQSGFRNSGVVCFGLQTQVELKTLFCLRDLIKKYNLPYTPLSLNSKVKLREPTILELGWVGRLGDDMLPVFNEAIDSLKENCSIDKVQNIVIHVISNEKFDNYNLNSGNVSISVQFYGPLYGEEMINFIHKNVGIGIGRGRVLHDFASQSKPFVLLPLGGSRRRDGFKFGYDEIGYVKKFDSLAGILNEIICDYDLYAKRSQSILISDYSSDNCLQKLKDVALSSSFYLGA
jgi:hypothetical protein